MGLLSKLVGGGVAEPIAAAGKAFDELFTSDEERLTRAEAMERVRNEPRLGQILTNQIEAASRNGFVAGWRPAIGWVCALGLLNALIVNPWIQWATCLFAAECIDGPKINIEQIIGLVVSMLGLAYYRTEEKKAGLAK